MKQSHNIHLASSDKCTGCSACVQSCPQGCISMYKNNEGFLQPHINTKLCIGCHKCENVCPVQKPIVPLDNMEYTAFALINKDVKALMQSSSGGVFYALSKWTIEHGGVVFGAKFEGIHVKHDYSETLQGIEPFMGSKYIQSEVGNTFLKVKEFLQKQRWVLYSGTPCQIAGLKKFLNKDFERLITLDFLCHGVPSPTIWEKYMNRLLLKLQAKDFKNIRFRTKLHTPTGTSFYFFFFFLGRDNVWHEYGKADTPYYAYFRKLIYRASCMQCQYRHLAVSGSDFTCGDCSNASQYHPNMSNDNGISFLILQSPLAYQIWKDIKDSFVVESEDISVMKERYANSCEETESARLKRNWHFANKLAQYIPLERMQFVYMHDKPSVVIKRKIQKIKHKLHKML